MSEKEFIFTHDQKVKCPSCKNFDMVYRTTTQQYFCKKCKKTWNSRLDFSEGTFKHKKILKESKTRMSFNIPSNIRGEFY